MLGLGMTAQEMLWPPSVRKKIPIARAADAFALGTQGPERSVTVVFTGSQALHAVGRGRGELSPLHFLANCKIRSSA